MNSLDVKDKRLLHEIELNARKGTSYLGSKIGLSQEATHYRLERLEKAGIISGYITFLDFAKIGYTGYAVYARFQRVTKEKKSEIFEGLKKNKHVYWIAEYGGRYDLVFGIMARNVGEFNEIFTGLSAKYHEHLQDMTVAIRVELKQFQRSYLLHDKSRRKRPSPRFGNQIRGVRLGQIDYQILEILSENTRLPIIGIAEKINCSPKTITQHLKKLESEDIIQGYGAIINCQKFGYQGYQLFINLNNLTENSRNRLTDYCRSHPNITFCIETIGRWNFEVVCEVESQADFQELTTDMRTNLSDIISDVESIVIFNQNIKYNQYALDTHN